MKQTQRIPSMISDLKISEHTKTTADETTTRPDKKLKSPLSILSNRVPSGR